LFSAVCVIARVGIKKPAQKNPPKKTQKNPLKKTQKNPPASGFFWVFLKGHSALSINLQFFPLKGL
jgi:hypothetical protein